MNSEIKLSFDTYRIYFSLFTIKTKYCFLYFIFDEQSERLFKGYCFDIVCQEYMSSNIYLNSIITME